MGWAGAAPPARPLSLSVRLHHEFPGFSLDIAFDAPTPGVVALFGSSGAGKSSVVAALAGLLRPNHMRAELDGTLLADTKAGLWQPPERRRVGLVFQDARLFPHLSVSGNLRYGLRRVRGPVADRRIGFDEVVEMLGIAHLLRRRPHTLSGGERSRVAIGRALLAQPLLLLMDEPLASLDAARKAEILPYLARLRDALRLPIVYVSHALEEVVRLSDTLVLIEAGRVLACGPLEAVAGRADLPIASRDDAGGVLAVRVAAHLPERGLTQLSTGRDEIWVPLLDAVPGTALRVRVPAREVMLARPDALTRPEAFSVHNALAGTVRALAQDAGGRTTLVEVALTGGALLARVTPDAINRLALRPGAAVLALFKSVTVEVLEDATSDALTDRFAMRG